MNLNPRILNLFFSTAIMLSFAGAMLFNDGRADINNYGEGWLETILAGAIVIMNILSEETDMRFGL